jgi:AraC-like DNA-binding protein
MPSSTLERESRLASFISTLLVRYSDAGAPSKRYGSARTGTRRACEYLREHFAENVSLARLAAVAGISPFHLHRRFSEHLGMPPHSFLTQLRVARARTLLRQGLSISEVAALTGFADQSHLTRHFKRFVGLTPGAYRAKSKNVQDGGVSAH